MKNLYIHIGAHKTGTTSIQNRLANAATWLAKQDYLYPPVCWYHFAQHRLGFAARNMADPDKGDKPDLKTELGHVVRLASESRHANIVISSEELFAAPPESIATFEMLKEHFDVTVIGFVRRQDELFSSMYNQNAKQPGNKFNKPAAFFLDKPKRLHRDMDMLACLDHWSAVFEGRVKVYRYEAGDVMENLCAGVGLESPPALERPHRLNPSVPPRALEAVRLMKLLPADKRIQRLILGEATALFESEGPVEPLLSAEEAKALLAGFQEDNETLFRKYGLGDNCYGPDAIDSEGRAETRPLSRMDLVALLARVCEKVEPA